MDLRYKANINYNNANNDNAEIANSWNWDITNIEFPAGIYSPGSSIFQGRLVSVGGLPEYNHDVQKVDMAGGFQNIQVGNVSHGAIDLTLKFQDFVDGTIGFFLKEWADGHCDPQTKLALPKSLLVMSFNLVKLTSSLNRVGQYEIKNCLLSSGGLGDEFNEKKNSNGKIDLKVTAEFWNYIPYNY